MALLLAACSGGGGKAAKTGKTTTTKELAPPTTTLSASTLPPVTSATRTTAAPVACPDSAQPDGAADVSSAQADVDGDGKPDTVKVYRLGPAAQIVSWHVRVERNGGGVADLALSGQNPGAGAVKLVGGANAAGDGSDEIFVRVGSGASTVLVEAFAFRNCRVEALTLNGEPLVLGVGGSVTHQDGVECTDADNDKSSDLVAYSAQSTDGKAFRGTTKVYKLSGSTLTLSRTDDLTYTVPDKQHTGFTCGSLTL